MSIPRTYKIEVSLPQTYKIESIHQIEVACAIAYYNQKARELKLAEDELKRLIGGDSEPLQRQDR